MPGNPSIGLKREPLAGPAIQDSLHVIHHHRRKWFNVKLIKESDDS
jgi:hypothetical protein